MPAPSVSRTNLEMSRSQNFRRRFYMRQILSLCLPPFCAHFEHPDVVYQEASS